MKTTTLNIFEFTDFRDLLKARFAELKAEDAKYSYAFVSRQTGQANSGWLKMAVTGKRRLPAHLVIPLARALGFDRPQQAFFTDLVDFNQALDQAQRDEALKRLRRKRGFTATHTMALRQVDYLDNPLAMVIREMVALPSFEEDPMWIASRLPESVDPRRILQAVELLLHLGLLIRDERGRLAQNNAIQFTGHGVASHALKRSYAHQLTQAAQALALPREARTFGFITMTLSRASFEAVNERLEALRQDIFDLVEKDQSCDQVYQFVMALYPLTRVDESWFEHGASYEEENCSESKEDHNEET